MKNRILLLAVAILVGVLTCVLPILFFSFGLYYMISGDQSVYTFADISECEAIVERAQANGTFEAYETSTSDREAKDLIYTAFFGGRYIDDTCSFEIYAYEFADRETAVTYFKRHTGKLSETESNFSGHLGIFKSDLVVLHGNTAYVVYMSSGDEQEVRKILAETFSIMIAEDMNLG